MATKNIYLYKVTIKDESTGIEVSLDQYKSLFQSIIAANSRNNALRLSTVDEPEVTILDIIDNTDECLFARLNRKKLNNSMQKRNYRTYEISDVLQPDEIAQNGVESFTYCILGYSHGILSMVFLIAYFILSLKEMYNLVNLIHKSDNSHIDEEIAAVKKQYFKK